MLAALQLQRSFPGDMVREPGILRADCEGHPGRQNMLPTSTGHGALPRRTDATCALAKGGGASWRRRGQARNRHEIGHRGRSFAASATEPSMRQTDHEVRPRSTSVFDFTGGIQPEKLVGIGIESPRDERVTPRGLSVAGYALHRHVKPADPILPCLRRVLHERCWIRALLRLATGRQASTWWAGRLSPKTSSGSSNSNSRFILIRRF